jgi:RimJ/RimL family protein N-acetyltransferase|tara:strand:+ start:3222 stop:3638 length:417 start_codon:yes stop_codon:yes gene_type:complete
LEKKPSVIGIRRVVDSDIRFLFNLLKERSTAENISHKKMPTYNEHKKFVKSKPYSRWYIIIFSNKMAGSIYLTRNNEIGIFLKKEFRAKNIGKKTLEMIIQKNPRKRYLANINPKNRKSINFFKRNHFKLIQYTLELE